LTQNELFSTKMYGPAYSNYTVSQKTRHLIFYHNFGKCEPIFKILSQPYL